MFSNTNLRMNLLVAVAVGTLCGTAVQAQEVILIETYTVQNHATWRTAFDRDAPMRRGRGMLASYVIKNPVEPNTVSVAYEWDTRENAQAYAAEFDTCGAVKSAGEAPNPTFRLIELDR